jgi:altronate dehydratase small subunit
MLKPEDKVAVALERIEKGSSVDVNCQGKYMTTVQLKESIDFGHKFAVVSIKKGDDILKYGEVIGAATIDIAEGEHVHVHNLEGKRGRGDIVHE